MSPGKNPSRSPASTAGHSARHRQICFPRTGRPNREGYIVRLYLLQVTDLARRAPMQIRPPRFQMRCFAAWPGLRTRGFNETQLHIFDREVARRLRIKPLECACGKLCLIVVTRYRKVLAAARDDNVKCIFDLTQIFIQHAAKMREPLVINRRERNFDGLQA
jgi:hypothetical protein